MSASDVVVPEFVRASAADLPPAVAEALAHAAPDLSGARWQTVTVGPIPWATYAWGDPSAPPLVLVHGVTSNAETFWRIAPAVAAAGRHVVALDLPGHGRTGHWQGRYPFSATAAELAACLRAAGLEGSEVTVLGHSWGGMVAAALPAAGLSPGTLILLDPPAVPLEAMRQMTIDPTERPFERLDDAMALIRRLNPKWSDGDIHAKALGLTQFSRDAVLAFLLENGDWDGGLASLADPAARDVPVWLIRGEFRAGGMVPDAVLPAFAGRIGADHVLTIAGAPHSPQRLYPEATVVAILRALGPA
jgi:pimeloyl-ACP methyl ester carboxylesterase